MGTHYKGTREEIRALDAYIKLMRAAESVTARLGRLLASAGLSVSQFGVMEALYHLGPMPQCDLARKLLKSGGNITTVVDNIERRRLVRRERAGEDRRFVTVHLSKEGRRLIAGFFPRHARAIVCEMSALRHAELETLGRLCRSLGLKQKTGRG